MERTKHIFIGLIFSFFILLPSGILNAQSTYKNLIYNAYINGDMNKWANVIYTIEQNEDNKTIDQKLELISYYYGYVGFLIGIKNYEKAQLMIPKGEKLISQVLAESPKNATAYAFKGSFIGFKIAMSKFKAMTLGPESAASLKKGYEIDPSNVQVLVDKANALYHTPKLFGGDKKEALKLFQKGLKLMESSMNTTNNWFYMNVLTLTARAHENLNQNEQALQLYEKILHIEPDYKWVKNELLPSLKKKM